MRSCAVCFFFVSTGVQEGDCMVDPPVPVLVNIEDTGEGRLETTFVSVRPVVGAQDFCSRFSHKAEKVVGARKVA